MSTEDDDAIPVEAVATDEVVKSADVAFADYYVQHSHTTSEHHVNDVLKHVGKGGVAKRASVFMGSPTAVVSPGPVTTSPGGPVRRQSKFAMKMASSSGGGDKCKKCTLTVYLAEKISSSNGIYHKRCFCCGLDGGTGCGRSLDAGNYDVYGGVIFCKTCSKKQHHGDKQIKTLSDGPMSPIGTGERRLSWKGGEERRPSTDTEGLPSPPPVSSAPAPLQPQAPQSVMGLFGAMKVDDEAEALGQADEGSETEVTPTVEAKPMVEAETETQTETAHTTEKPAERTGESQPDSHTIEGESASPLLAAVADKDEEDDDEYENEYEEEGEGESEDTFEVAPPATESPASSPPRERRPSIDPLPGQKSFHECPFTFPFDKNGAIYWVGSMGGAIDYENPQKTGSLYLEISTLYRGQLLNITSYQAAESAADRIAAATYTNNTSKSWLVVDFGPERKLRPSYYCLKHGASGIGNAVRNWTLEGKVEEESPWVELRKHVNDTTMREEPQSVAGYELSSEVCRGNFFRIFRLTQHGKNSGGNDCLFIGGIDFYGIMKVEKALL